MESIFFSPQIKDLSFYLLLFIVFYDLIQVYININIVSKLLKCNDMKI